VLVPGVAPRKPGQSPSGSPRVERRSAVAIGFCLLAWFRLAPRAQPPGLPSMSDLAHAATQVSQSDTIQALQVHLGGNLIGGGSFGMGNPVSGCSNPKFLVRWPSRSDWRRRVQPDPAGCRFSESFVGPFASAEIDRPRRFPCHATKAAHRRSWCASIRLVGVGAFWRLPRICAPLIGGALAGYEWQCSR